MRGWGWESRARVAGVGGPLSWWKSREERWAVVPGVMGSWPRRNYERSW